MQHCESQPLNYESGLINSSKVDSQIRRRSITKPSSQKVGRCGKTTKYRFSEQNNKHQALTRLTDQKRNYEYFWPLSESKRLHAKKAVAEQGRVIFMNICKMYCARILFFLLRPSFAIQVFPSNWFLSAVNLMMNVLKRFRASFSLNSKYLQDIVRVLKMDLGQRYVVNQKPC